MVLHNTLYSGMLKWVLYYLSISLPNKCDVLSGSNLSHESHLLPLSALVFMSQIVVYTIRLNVPMHMYIENILTGFPYVALQVLLVLCGIWSLDFVRVPT